MTTGPDDTRMLGDRYQIGMVIGRGGMAEVHEGRDLRLGRRVAVKILRPDLAKDPTFQARFRREAQSAAALNHPNIVAVYDTGEDLLASDGISMTVPYIVMEYVDGMTLRQLLSSGRRLLPERALEITGGILAALDYAHRHGIVHRDIKPANVMLTRTGDVKVMDFGIARAMNDAGTTMTSTSAVMGTAQYLSPEQARGEVVDARSDLYSTGVLLYELLTGRPPFTGDSPVSIAYQHVSEMPVPPSQVDPDVTPPVDAVVLRALAKRTDDRYQTAADFRADVERAIAGSPVTAAVPMVMADRTQMLPPVQAATGAYEPMYDVDRPRTRRRGRSAAFWILGILGLALAAFSTWAIVTLIPWSSASSRVTVPSLSGMTIEQATTALEDPDVGLRLGTQTPEVSDQPENTIVNQQPAAGETIERGQSVNVTISSGMEQVTVPQLVTLTSVDAARIALLDAGLQLGTIKSRNSQQPEGYVLAQEPSEGTQVDAGSSVDITVSSGLVKVPNVKNLTEAQARSDLAQSGFEVQSVEIEDGSVPGGTVLAQSPKSGELLPRGSTVTITVSTSPPEPTPTPTPTPTETPVEPTEPPVETTAPPASEFAPSP